MQRLGSVVFAGHPRRWETPDTQFLVVFLVPLRELFGSVQVSGLEQAAESRKEGC